MQNRYCSPDGAGYVSLSGSWNCARCGCANEGCDVCRGCGWNRCGCQGGVVRGASCVQRAAQERREACDDCPADFAAGHRVQRCPDNTRIRREEDCACAAAAADRSCTARKAYECASRPASCQTTREERVCPAAVEADCGCTAQRGQNARVGIVHAAKQELAEVFESESALRTGTLFPELHKPMNGRCPACSNCSTCQQQNAFAAWDLRLYLNTHPDDAEALALFRRLCGEADEPNYATTFLEEGCTWRWTDDPWPWECGKCGD